MSPSRYSKKKKSSFHLKLSRSYIALLVGVGLALLFSASGFAFAASKETHDTFCSSCHTQPESTFYQRSIDSKPVDLASVHKEKGTRCIDCHSGIGLFGRLQAELLGAHNALAFYSHTAVQPAALTRPISDGSCLKCHQRVVAQAADRNNHFHVFLSRWQNQDPNAASCVSCHQAHVTDVDASIQYMNRDRAIQVCEACHQVLGGGE
jgi:predicted CXXCH cytochrome family protein